MIERVRALLAAGRRTRVGRTLTRYSTARGALMAGGIAYTGMFSIFAVLVIGISLLMAMLGNRPVFRAAVVDSINSLLPGVIDSGNGQGLVSVDQLTLTSALNLGSVVAAGTFIYSVISLMGTLKIALRAMFGLVNPTMRPLMGQLANIAGFLVIVAGVLVTAVASVVTTTLSGSVGRALGLPDSLTGTGAWLITLLLSFLIDAGILALLVSICGIRPPWRDLTLGCMLGALALGALRQVGTGAVGTVTRNPLLASFAAIAVLVLWLHLTSRIVLLMAAWMANPPLPRDVDHPDEVHAHERPNYVTLSVPETLAWPRQSITGSLEADPTAHPDYVPPVPIP
ncbi:YihY/virulence factor BrkB family protein [Actinomyces sp. ZJ308]|uniref:YihY/virulence factor BrkB family protein n=1 Tax=Actinomyces sp. ZJ308 TaxID=2708342 RepID=UPI001423F637|nr:YihY/virulence factor BrkB family protein [Actinomyces sp. ZJ308]